MKWVQAVFIGTLFLWLLTPSVTAHPILIIDQRNDNFPITGGFGFGASPLGQEFTPTLPALNVVEILIGPRDLATVALVNIRIGSIGGPIIGTSLPGIIDGSAIHFDFSSIVSLVPGNLYVLEPILLEGSFGLIFSDTDSYAGGRAIVFGKPVSDRDMGFREGVTVPAVCDVQLNKTSFVNGDQVIAQVVRVTNLTATRVEVEYKLWFDLPGGAPFGFLHGGEDGSFVLDVGFNHDFGPLALGTVTPALPRGTYAFNCRFLDPVTGKFLSEDLNPFDIR